MQELIDKHIADPKAMYRVINQSYGKNQEGYVAKNLISRLEKDPENPQLTIITVYAVVQAAGSGSRALWLPGTLESKSLVFSRDYFFSSITPDLWKDLSDPALMIMAAVARNEKLKESVDDNMQPHRAEEKLPVIDLCRRAVAIDPKWGDAHYWYGRMLLSYFYDFGPKERENRRDLLLNSKAELLKAAELDEGLKSDCYWHLTFVSEDLDQPKEALAYLEKALQLRRPGYGISPELIERTRKRLQGQIRAK